MGQNIYIVISKTPTGIGKLIRKVAKVKYNHASMSFDSDLHEIYAFARQKYTVLLTAKLVKENISRFTLDKVDTIDTTIFKIPVSDEVYMDVRRTVNQISYDPEYIYNYSSLITYPITKGISVYKAFTCIEFVMFILTQLGYTFDKPLCTYKPDDLLKILEDKIYYQGNLVEYVEEKKVESDFFDKANIPDVKNSFISLYRLLYRTLGFRKNQLY